MDNGGDYTVSAVVDASNSGANSFFVGIDAEPTDPAMIWDIQPDTNSFDSRTVGWRGTGTFDNAQYPVKIFSLSAGTHQLIVRGREPNTLLRNISIVGLSFAASSGTITTPFSVDNNGDVSQSVETGLSNSGRAAYSFTVSQGDYTVSAVVDASNSGADSFFLNIDAEPTDPAMIWDIQPDTNSFESRTVSWRGTGTFDNVQYPVKIFSLSAGTHQLIVRGREPNALLRRITIVPTTEPPPPSGLRTSSP